MIGQEHHRHFAIKCFAQFMTRSQVVNAFMDEFQDELTKPTHKMALWRRVSLSEYYRINKLIFMQIVHLCRKLEVYGTKRRMVYRETPSLRNAIG